MKKSFETRMDDAKHLTKLRERVKSLKEERGAQKREQAKRAKEREERRKLNEFKSAKVEVIKDLSKTRKWNKKARKTLAKLPAEIFYEKFK